MRTGLLVGLVLLLTSCGSRRSTPPAERPYEAVSAPPVAISLERTACFGRCPVYAISVSPEGVVRYEGKANVKQIGTDTAQIPRERVEALLLELEGAGYFTFSNRYALSEPTCRRHSTDSPSAISAATFRGRTKRIEHDYGCGGVPGALTVMEKRIDEVLGSDRWTGR